MNCYMCVHKCSQNRTISRHRIKKIGLPLPKFHPRWGGRHPSPNSTPSAPRHSHVRRSTCAPSIPILDLPLRSSINAVCFRQAGTMLLQLHHAVIGINIIGVNVSLTLESRRQSFTMHR